eukprot:jgi/Tetstr1/426591/TSEL_016869.t1
MRTSTEPMPSGRTRSGSPDGLRPLLARGGVVLVERKDGSAPPIGAAASSKAARTLADRRRFRGRALRDVPAGTSPASIR